MTKPAQAIEFMLIVINWLSPRCCHDVPQRHISVTRSETARRSACNHQGLGNVVSGGETEFLSELTFYCFAGMLLWLDVTSGRKPELRIFMIH